MFLGSVSSAFCSNQLGAGWTRARLGNHPDADSGGNNWPKTSLNFSLTNRLSLTKQLFRSENQWQEVFVSLRWFFIFHLWLFTFYLFFQKKSLHSKSRVRQQSSSFSHLQMSLPFSREPLFFRSRFAKKKMVSLENGQNSFVRKTFPFLDWTNNCFSLKLGLKSTAFCRFSTAVLSICELELRV